MRTKSKKPSTVKVTSIDDIGGRVLVAATNESLEGKEVAAYVDGQQSGIANISNGSALIKLNSALPNHYSITLKLIP